MKFSVSPDAIREQHSFLPRMRSAGRAILTEILRVARLSRRSFAESYPGLRGNLFPAYYYPFLPAFVGAPPPRMRLNPSVNLVGVPQHYVGAEPDEERITEQDAVRTCCRYTHEDPIRRARNNPVIQCLVWFADTWLTVSCSSGRRLIFDSLDPERIVPAVELRPARQLLPCKSSLRRPRPTDPAISSKKKTNCVPRAGKRR